MTPQKKTNILNIYFFLILIFENFLKIHNGGKAVEFVQKY